MSDSANSSSASSGSGAGASGMDAGLEAEIAAALGDMSVEDMLDYGERPARRGERTHRTGVITGVRDQDVFVEFGPKSQGICPISHFKEPPVVGSSMDFAVDRYDESDGLLMLSREGVVRKADYDAMDVGQVIEARCTGTNKGGLEMEVASHKAFMPAGQVDVRHIEDLSVFVGEKMPCEIIELDKNRGRIVLSRRKHMEEERARIREKMLEELVVGNTMQATITNVREFGAFADLGGIEGLIHVSDLSWNRVKNVRDVVKEGDIVQVEILKIDQTQTPPRLSLGMKQTMEDPFTQQADAIEDGATVTGRVTRTTDFGAFVEVSDGVEGLIHISELAHKRVNKVESIVKEGEVVTVKVLSIDGERRRISLSLKAMQDSPDTATFEREEDASMRRMREQLNSKFGGNLKGGLG